MTTIPPRPPRKIAVQAERHALVTAVLLALVYFAGLQFVVLFLRDHAPNLPSFVYGLLLYALFVVVGIVLLTAFGWWREAGFVAPARWRHRGLWLPLALWLLIEIGGLIALSPHVELGALLTGNHLTSWGQFVFFTLILLVYTLLIAFTEETFFRGLALCALERYGWMNAALISSVLFGLAHLSNALVPYTPAELALRAVQAALFGFFFAAVRLRMRTIWPTLIVHALFDTTFTLVVGAFQPDVYSLPWSIVTQGVSLVFAAYGVYLIRRGERNGA